MCSPWEQYVFPGPATQSEMQDHNPVKTWGEDGEQRILLSFRDTVSVLNALIIAPWHLPAQLLTQSLEQKLLSSPYRSLSAGAVWWPDATLPSPAETCLGAEAHISYLRHVIPSLVPRHKQTRGLHSAVGSLKPPSGKQT